MKKVETRYYKVSGHVFSISGDEDYFALMVNYEPFVCADGETVFADGLHHTENELASTVPMWHLECLPDEAAARLCHDTITR